MGTKDKVSTGDIERMRQMRADGLADAAIADTLGVTRAVIAYHLGYRNSQWAGADEAVYQAIVQYKRENGGISPRYCDIAKIAGYQNETSIGHILRRLERDGRIFRNEQFRAIQLPGERWIAPGEKKNED